MFQQEIICNECNQHYIVVTKSEEEILYCPFCSVEIGYTRPEYEEEDE